jgi:hypothetical protein
MNPKSHSDLAIQFDERITPRDMARQKLLDMAGPDRVRTLCSAFMDGLERDPIVVQAMVDSLLTSEKPQVANVLWAVLEDYLVNK